MTTTAIDRIKAKPLTQVTTVKELLWNDQARQQLATVSARHLNPERMMRLVAGALRTTPKLAECDPMSLLGGLMTCASLGLEPNTIMGHAYLIPFRNNKKGATEVQLVIGYKGLVDLARRSGHITSIAANIHYSDDDLWQYEEGTEATLRHVPGPQEGQRLHAYAIAKFKDGGHAYVVLPWAKVMKTRDGSQGWQTAVRFGSTDKNPWKTHEDEMAKKTAIRALAKYLPLSVEFRDAMTVDGAQADFAAYARDPMALRDITPEDDEPQMGALDMDPEPEPEPEPEPKRKPAPRRQAAKPEPDPQPELDIEADARAGLVALIKREIDQCNTTDEITAVIELYGEQIASLPHAAQSEIEQHERARRAGVAE